MLSFLVNRASVALGRLSGPGDEALALPLRRLLSMKNGFRALDDALLVLPAESTRALPGLSAWNAGDGWRRWFDLDPGLTFFAMDATLRQFAVDEAGQVLRFDPVGEQLELFAADLDEWAERLIAGAAGQALTRAWQVTHRPLHLAERLLPATFGGSVTASHLADGMEVLGERAAGRVETSREYDVYELAFV